MLFIRELSQKLSISTMYLKRIKYFKNNIVNLDDLQELENIFINKQTNNSLIKAKKIKKIIKDLDLEKTHLI